jgi:hypothetical protein
MRFDRFFDDRRIWYCYEYQILRDHGRRGAEQEMHEPGVTLGMV